MRVPLTLGAAILTSLFLALGTTDSLLAQPDHKPLAVPGVVEHLDVRYLPDSRYTGQEGPRGDAEMHLDIYVPSGPGPFPVAMIVHGGGYGGGDKRLGGSTRRLAERFLEEGFAVVSPNYILHPRGIYPQVFWDFRDAVRFLRRSASKYRLDPLRIGACGLSAGGWLVSSAVVGNGDLIRRSNDRALTVVELREAGWKMRTRRTGEPDAWLRPMRSPSPAWPGVHGGLSAVSLDFDHYLWHLKPFNPPLQKWAGEGFTPKYQEALEKNGAEGLLEIAPMVAEKYRGKKVHVPPFYPGRDKNSDEALARGRGGQSVPLGEVIIDFFRRRLVESCRLPAPEIFPVPRVFENEAEVSIVSLPGTTVHYTTDGQTPTTESPVYRDPFTITGDTVVRALAVHEKMSSSGVNSARFVKGPEPPRIVAPLELPPARTGEPYRVKFTSSRDSARWLIQGDLVPRSTHRDPHRSYPNGMALDQQTGEWSGTPHRPGRYRIQIWVSAEDGALARHRDYLWEVTGPERPELAWSERLARPETLAGIARLVIVDGWHRGLQKELGNALHDRGVRHAVIGEGDVERWLRVDPAHASRAREALEAFLARFEKLRPKTEIPPAD